MKPFKIKTIGKTFLIDFEMILTDFLRSNPLIIAIFVLLQAQWEDKKAISSFLFCLPY